MKKVLLTGSRGQLGRTLVNQLESSEYIVAAHDVDTLDLLDRNAVSQCFTHFSPEVVINAAAYTAVDLAESEPDKADAINHGVVKYLVTECVKHRARLIQVSTDFVFDGLRSLPYTPDDACAPLNVYGKTKLEGEQAVLNETQCQGLVIRTAWLYSAFGNNFVRTMLRLMAERDELKIVCDQTGTPTAASGLAQLLLKALERPELTGVYHWTDAGTASWYDFAVAIYEEATALGLLTTPVNLIPIPTNEYPTPATRPHYSVLDKTATYRDFALSPMHWRCQLRAVLQTLKECSEQGNQE